MPKELLEDEIHTRIITAPDGTDYLVALPGWYWNSLDWMHVNTVWKDRDFIELAWSTAREVENDGLMKFPGNFGAEFSFAFKAHIWTRMVNLINIENGAANRGF